MKVLPFGAAALTAVVLAAGCSSSDGASSRQTQPVQGGQVDQTHDYAVGVCAGNGPGQCQLICSGALIAPNLVMLARHCVDQTPQAIDCTSASTVFGSQYGPAGAFFVTTNYQMLGTTKGYHTAKQIFTTPGNKVCGNDMALIELEDNVSVAEAGGAFVTPVVQYSMTDHTRYSTQVTAIGYGDTSATTQDAGTRHILQSIDLICIPGDPIIDCGQQSQITPNEFVSGNSTCEGDSGSSAYEQKAFNKNIPVSFGVLSRGGSSGSTCVEPIYTRTDAWKDFIINTALTAASDGGYTPPSWTGAPPPPNDGGAPDSGTTSDGAAPPPPGSLGATCGDPTDCDSGLCLSDDGGNSYICSATCDPTGDGSDCGQSGYVCQDDGQGNGFCFPGQADTPTSGGGGGCAVGSSDPSKPIPWGTLALAGLFCAVAMIRSRRRDE
ncbi:MAG TPA: trypsin-like serine protease [Polyangiaceae bacterium]|jgi:V8-like Glu-specific endopeptidase